jgi:hypothetical protein
MSDQATIAEAEKATDQPKAADAATEFSREAEASQPGLLREFWDFLMHNKKWWLAPIVIILLLFGLLIVLAGTGAAPFIYTLF